MNLLLLPDSLGFIRTSLSNGINCSWGIRNSVHFHRILFVLYFNTLSAFNNFNNKRKRFMFIDHERCLKHFFSLELLTLKGICSFYASKHQDCAFFRIQNRHQPLQTKCLPLQACKKTGVNLTPRRRSFPQQRILKTQRFDSHFILRFHMQVNPPERVNKWWMHGMNQLYTDQELNTWGCR